MMTGQAGCLLQVLHSSDAATLHQLASGNVLKVVPPALRPEHPSPHLKSLWGWLSTGFNRKEDQWNDTAKASDGSSSTARQPSAATQAQAVCKEEQGTSVCPLTITPFTPHFLEHHRCWRCPWALIGQTHTRHLICLRFTLSVIPLCTWKYRTHFV